MRKCRNWQTSKTKDLVTVYVVWVQVPSSARTKGIGSLNRFFFCLYGRGLSPSSFAAWVLGFTLDSEEPRQVFTHGSH